MGYPVTLNGTVYTAADFDGTAYVTGFPNALSDMVSHQGNIYKETSTTSNSIGTGSKTFTITAGKPYQNGTPLRISSDASPTTHYMDVVVASYSTTSLVVTVVGYAGSGTKTDWSINIAGSANLTSGTVPVSQGGTGATNATDAKTNLGITASGDVVGPGSATNNAITRFDTTTGKLLQNSGATIDDSGNIAAAGLTLTSALPVAQGGTGATSASAARTALGLVISTDVLAHDANLQSFVTAFTLPTSDGAANQALVTNGSATLSFADAGISTGKSIAMAMVFG